MIDRILRVVAAALLFGCGVTAAAQSLEPLVPLAGGVVTYRIYEGDPAAGYRPGDRELAEWALQTWERAAGGRLKLVAGTDSEALLQIGFVGADAGQYGEMRPIRVDGRRGAAVYVRPDTDALGPDIGTRARLDSLYRDTVVYLTCVHELGHALGLTHTAEYADIMFFFGFGGDIPGFFNRFRERIAVRGDIATAPVLSSGDLAQLQALYPPQ